MKSLIAITVLLAASASAHAEKPRPTLELGVTAGADEAMHHEAMFVGVELSLSPIWRFHAQLARGSANNSAMSNGSNFYGSMRAGFEAHPCPTRGICVIAGVDAAFMTESYKIGATNDGIGGVWDEIEERGGFALVPRFALDVGDGRWHFRPGVEATVSTTVSGGNAGNSDLIGVAGNLAVAYAW